MYIIKSDVAAVRAVGALIEWGLLHEEHLMKPSSELDAHETDDGYVGVSIIPWIINNGDHWSFDLGLDHIIVKSFYFFRPNIVPLGEDLSLDGYAEQCVAVITSWITEHVTVGQDGYVVIH